MSGETEKHIMPRINQVSKKGSDRTRTKMKFLYNQVL